MLNRSLLSGAGLAASRRAQAPDGGKSPAAGRPASPCLCPRWRIAPVLSEGSLQDAVRLDQVADAHEHMRANRHFGKIVLLP